MCGRYIYIYINIYIYIAIYSTPPISPFMRQAPAILQDKVQALFWPGTSAGVFFGNLDLGYKHFNRLKLSKFGFLKLFPFQRNMSNLGTSVPPSAVPFLLVARKQKHQHELTMSTRPGEAQAPAAFAPVYLKHASRNQASVAIRQKLRDARDIFLGADPAIIERRARRPGFGSPFCCRLAPPLMSFNPWVPLLK